MLVTMFPWFFRRPILIGSLLMFLITWLYIWIAWFAIPPDWYLAYKFALEKEKFYKLASMIREDEALYGNITSHSSDTGCCVIRIDDFGRVKLKMTSRKGLTDLRLEEYESLMSDIGVIKVRVMSRGKMPVRITNSISIGHSVSYLYSEDEPINFDEYIYYITNGISVSRYWQLDGKWYLIHDPPR
ncbi:MAG: hypothetical protein HQL59_07935 [Magnetococcales bacterium]|nr:hypothetical protein [Magnetococcales bacterium]